MIGLNRHPICSLSFSSDRGANALQSLACMSYSIFSKIMFLPNSQLFLPLFPLNFRVSFIHAGDPQYEEALRLDPAFVPVKPIQPSPTQRSSDRGRRGHRQAHDRSRDRSPRRDDYRRRQDRPRGRSISRDRSSSPSPPQIRGFELPSPPRSSRSESRQVKPSPSSGGPALPDEKPASSRSWETTPIYLNPSGVPRSSTFSKYPYSSILLTVDPKLSWDSALMRSGLDRLKKAENSFKSRSHALEEASPDDKLDVSSSITWISSIALKVSGHFCDVYEGTHVVRGKVALKRPRLGGLAYNEISRVGLSTRFGPGLKADELLSSSRDLKEKP